MSQDMESKACMQVLRKNNLFPIRRLGKGGFGSVYLVSRSSSRYNQTQLLSVKCTNKKNFTKKPQMRKYLKQQTEVQSSVAHPNLVKLIRTFQDQGWHFMIMEYCQLGNLYTTQSQKPRKVYQLNEAKKFMTDILEGILHLHSKSIIHRDLKPQNILLTRNNSSVDVRAKICDFGFAKQTQQEVSTFCGTTYFMAPEIFAKQKYDHQVDTWAAGVVFFYMLFGFYPFKSLNMAAQIQQKCKDGFDLQSMKGIDLQQFKSQEKSLLIKLFARIFRINPNQRINLVDFKKALTVNQNKKRNDGSQESTIEIDSDEERQIIQNISQQIVFVQKVFQQSKSLGFLTGAQELALKYYLDKYCISLLLLNRKACQSNAAMMKLKRQIETNHEKDSIILAANLSKIDMTKFSQLFSTVQTPHFIEYKQAYRLVLSYVFTKATKLIQDPLVRSRMKLKIFCCHSINRVFDPQYVPDILIHFFNFNKRAKPSNFKINDISKWIQVQSQDRINDTVRILCDKFYKKNK